MRLIDADAFAEWVHINVPADGPDALITKSFVMAGLKTKSVTRTVGLRFGRWKKEKGDNLTPGGTPYYVCALCGGSGHFVEFPKRKAVCDECGAVNSYPWEQIYEETSSLAEMDGDT